MNAALNQTYVKLYISNMILLSEAHAWGLDLFIFSPLLFWAGAKIGHKHLYESYRNKKKTRKNSMRIKNKNEQEWPLIIITAIYGYGVIY